MKNKYVFLGLSIFLVLIVIVLADTLTTFSPGALSGVNVTFEDSGNNTTYYINLTINAIVQNASFNITGYQFNNWRERNPSTNITIAKCDGSGVTYDSQLDLLVSYGGWSTCSTGQTPADTAWYFYNYSANSWSSRTPVTTWELAAFEITWDSKRNVTYIHGGQWSFPASDATRKRTYRYNYSDGVLTQLVDQAGMDNIQGAMVYDVLNDTLIMYGGRTHMSDDTNGLNTTYQFNIGTTTWSNISTGQQPPRRWNHTIVYDPTRNVSYMFGGATGSTPVNYVDTWRYNASINAWTNLTPTGQIPRGNYRQRAVYVKQFDILFASGDDGNYLYNITANSWSRILNTVPATDTFLHGLGYTNVTNLTLSTGRTSTREYNNTNITWPTNFTIDIAGDSTIEFNATYGATSRQFDTLNGTGNISTPLNSSALTSCTSPSVSSSSYCAVAVVLNSKTKGAIEISNLSVVYVFSATIHNLYMDVNKTLFWNNNKGVLNISNATFANFTVCYQGNNTCPINDVNGTGWSCSLSTTSYCIVNSSLVRFDAGGIWWVNVSAGNSSGGGNVTSSIRINISDDNILDTSAANFNDVIGVNKTFNRSINSGTNETLNYSASFVFNNVTTETYFNYGCIQNNGSNRYIVGNGTWSCWIRPKSPATNNSEIDTHYYNITVNRSQIVNNYWNNITGQYQISNVSADLTINTTEWGWGSIQQNTAITNVLNITCTGNQSCHFVNFTRIGTPLMPGTFTTNNSNFNLTNGTWRQVQITLTPNGDAVGAYTQLISAYSTGNISGGNISTSNSLTSTGTVTAAGGGGGGGGGGGAGTSITQQIIQPGGPLCGNNICDEGESAFLCAQDCGIELSSVLSGSPFFYFVLIIVGASFIYFIVLDTKKKSRRVR